MSELNLSLINELLVALWERKGTDLLITPGAPPLCRVDGAIAPLEDRAPLTAEDTHRLIMGMLSKEAGKELAERKEVDFSFNWHSMARFRGNAFHQRNSLALSLRLIPFHIPGFEELGLPPIAEQFAQLPQGLILFTGPTGSGKSTSQASIIDWINTNRACHIITIEDPIEYLHEHKRSAVNQREVGEDTRSFGFALRSALREDPDVVLVGEMRDPESIQTVLTIAETGHLVFATLHTNDTATALDRIVDVFPSDRQAQIRVQLSATLAAVVAQRLVPRIGGGLVAAFEIMVATSAARNLIREGKTNQLRNVISTSQKDGMQTLEDSLSELVAAGTVSYEDAVSRSVHVKEVKQPAPPEPVVATSGRGRRARAS